MVKWCGANFVGLYFLLSLCLINCSASEFQRTSLSEDKQLHKGSYLDEKFMKRHQVIDPITFQNTNISNVNATLEQDDHISSEENKTQDVKQEPPGASSAVPAAFTDSRTELDDINEFDAESLITNGLLMNNVIKLKNDYHYYYNSTMVVNEALAKEYWISFKNISANTLLSNSHRRAMTVQLSFDFPFYGHPVRNVTVSTGGFLYTGEYVHSWLAATQYIAPLMANFNTSLSNDSFVKFADSGTAFTVIWENVFLHDREDIGSFTFITTLHKNGNIVFAYISVPSSIASIQDNKRAIKVGISDAYIMDKVVFFAKRKTIYEYHRVNFDIREIQNWTIIYLSAQPTCLGYTDCMSCLTHETKFECTWCPELNKCSTGIDRKRQDWLQKGCDESKIEDSSHCPAIGQKGNNSGQETQNEFAYSKGASLSENEPKPLVGVNGTGQRKDYPEVSTPKPAIVSDPINPPQKTPKISTPKKAFTDSKTGLDDDIIDNIDVADAESATKTDLLKNNLKNFTYDYHYYYNSTMVVNEALAKEYWTSFKNISANTLLSKSHRRAMTVLLSFDFPFYGHPVRNVTVATGGFLYTGEYVHSWLAPLQYIAPLMANFDTSLSNDSFVKFADNGTAFTVIWENVFLQDSEDIGSFTFSTTLHKNGDIVFAYFSVPILIASIKNNKHPVKIGVSDAYIIDKVVFFARRKTIYEYHRVNFGSQEIQNWTIIYLSAQPTCLGYTDCMSCLTHDTKFKCTWCPELNKCSTSMDRKRQDWLQKGCDRSQIEDSSHCPAIGQKGNNSGQETQEVSIESTESYQKESHDITVRGKEEVPIYEKSSMEKPADRSERSNVGLSLGLVGLSLVGLGLILPICLVMSALVWVLYAYRNPHTKSG